MTRITTTSPLAVSADYHDALVTARRAKNWLFLLLLLALIAQIAIFCLVRFNVVSISAAGSAARVNAPDVEADVDVTNRPTTAPGGAAGTDTDVDASASVTTRPSNLADKVGGETNVARFLAWTINSIVYLGSVLFIVLCIIVLLIVLIMVVGRLLGVANSTSAFVWAVILAALVFPWQLFHGHETGPSAPAYSSAHMAPAPAGPYDDFRVPGALYTWGELRRDARFGLDGHESSTGNTVLKWARFVGFPVVALVLLFMVQAKSGRGIKYALGEAEVHVDVNTTNV